MNTLAHKRVLVTGGAQGLGFAIATACAAEGASVLLLDVDTAALERARAQLGAATFACDITNLAQVRTTLAAVREQHPDGLDALVNNAGVFTSNAIERADPGRGALALAVNVTGTMNVTNTVLDEGVLRPGAGQVLFVNSSAGDPLSTGTGKSERTYAASKGALTAYAKAIEGAAAGTPLRVTTIYPGGMDTNLYVNAGMSEEAGRGQSWMMPPARVAAAVVFVLGLPADTTVSRLAIGPNP